MPLLAPMRKRARIAFAILALVMLAGGVYVWFAADPGSRLGLTEGQYRRVQDGMTVAEVIAIMDQPPTTSEVLDHGQQRLVWSRNLQWIEVRFASGRVIGKRVDY